MVAVNKAALTFRLVRSHAARTVPRLRENGELTTATRSTTWSPLVFTAFRWLWIASIVSNVGTWMQNVGAAWLMTSLPQATPMLVALVQTATNLPVFMLGVPAGAIADLVDRRKLLLITQ